MDCATAAAAKKAQKAQHKELLCTSDRRDMRESISRRGDAEPVEDLTLKRTPVPMGDLSESA